MNRENLLPWLIEAQALVVSLIWSLKVSTTGDSLTRRYALVFSQGSFLEAQAGVNAVQYSQVVVHGKEVCRSR